MLSERVLAAIRRHHPSGAPPILLACSGGLDSQVLLDTAAAVWPAGSLFVAHVHHGLQPEAEEWLDFCEAVAARRGLPFLSRRLPALPVRVQGGIEAWARRLRYQALADMAADAGASLVLTAHHANDQLETHHLRRARGAGALGLGAMRDFAPLPGAPHLLLLRPFLGVCREQIADYAREHRLAWVEDPSNQDMRYARNRIRREMAQGLLQDSTSLQRGLAAIGEFQAVADAVRRRAAEDLAGSLMMLTPAETGVEFRAGEPAGTGFLSRGALARLSQERAAEVLRLWLADLGCRMPARPKMNELLRQLVAGASARACLQHDGVWLLRYRDRIDALVDLPEPVTTTAFRWSGEPLLIVAGQRFLFDRLPPEGTATLEGAGGREGREGNEGLGGSRGAATAIGAEGRPASILTGGGARDVSRDAGRGAAEEAGIDAQWLAAADLVMDRARGVDRLRLVSGGCRRTWKNLSQERGIPPWMRAALPLLRRADQVVYAAPFGLNRDAAALEPGPAPRPAGLPESRAGAPSGRVVIRWLAPPVLARWL